MADGLFGSARLSLLRATFTNDKMGRLTRQQDFVYDELMGAQETSYDRQVTLNAKGQITNETVNARRGNDIFNDVVTNTFGTGTGYALGAVLTTASTVSKNGSDSAAPNTSTTNTYNWRDGAVVATSTYKPDVNQSTTWTSTYNYSASGQLGTVGIADGRSRTVTFTNDMAGQVIRRDESDNNATNGDPHEIWYRFDGKEMGYTGNNSTLDTDYFTSIGNRLKTAPGTGQTGAFRFGTVAGGSHASFDPSVDPINSFEQGSSAGGYTARGGETLQQIAASLWGDCIALV